MNGCDKCFWNANAFKCKCIQAISVYALHCIMFIPTFMNPTWIHSYLAVCPVSHIKSENTLYKWDSRYTLVTTGLILSLSGYITILWVKKSSQKWTFYPLLLIEMFLFYTVQSVPLACRLYSSVILLKYQGGSRMPFQKNHTWPFYCLLGISPLFHYTPTPFFHSFSDRLTLITPNTPSFSLPFILSPISLSLTAYYLS